MEGTPFGFTMFHVVGLLFFFKSSCLPGWGLSLNVDCFFGFFFGRRWWSPPSVLLALEVSLQRIQGYGCLQDRGHQQWAGPFSQALGEVVVLVHLGSCTKLQQTG